MKVSGDGKGTAKTLLDKIAGLESEAQKSFMHRSVICWNFRDSLAYLFPIAFRAIVIIKYILYYGIEVLQFFF